MAQEEKELLLKDLCARLPYGVKINCFDVPRTLESISIDSDGFVTIDCGGEHFYHPLSNILHKDCLPYLRPMSSMTEEEAEQIIKFICEDSIGVTKINIRQDHITAKVDYLIGDPETVFVWFDNIIHSIEILDFLNACHLDYRGLISMRLALEAPEGMYNTKTE